MRRPSLVNRRRWFRSPGESDAVRRWGGDLFYCVGSGFRSFKGSLLGRGVPASSPWILGAGTPIIDVAGRSNGSWGDGGCDCREVAGYPCYWCLGLLGRRPPHPPAVVSGEALWPRVVCEIPGRASYLAILTDGVDIPPDPAGIPVKVAREGRAAPIFSSCSWDAPVPAPERGRVNPLVGILALGFLLAGAAQRSVNACLPV